MRDWAGMRYWLLGADTPLGAALAEKLSRAGVSLVLSGRDQGRLEDLMVTLPGRASYIPLDITQEQGLEDVAIELGTINGLVYALDEHCRASSEHWNAAGVGRVISTNLTGIANALGIALPIFAGRGHIVLLDSLAGIGGAPGQAGYAASKAGVRLLAESLAVDAKGTELAVQLVTLGVPGGWIDVAPDTAAAGIFEHMGTPRFRRTVPSAAGVLVRLLHALPGWLTRPAVAWLTKQAQD
ncbi:SDR family NAD(P)-dependent oxidoreductase [Nioella aestuarii]|uniref:SDR family NAD(P)-dependent oxidoreductase n=1 Tax=Nioella aestuarii TaxID=1662864 RepID=UPI003D7F772B